MRKRVNILFVALATIAVVYGMISKYSSEPINEIAKQQEQQTEQDDDIVRFDDDIVDLDALTGNPD